MTESIEDASVSDLRRCAGAPQGTAQIAVDRIAGGEPIEAKLDAIQARFVDTY